MHNNNLQFTILGLILATLVSAPVRAEEKDEARIHFKAGLTLFKAEDYDAAATEFERSVALHTTKGGLFNLANCYRALHRYGDALVILEQLAEQYKGRMKKEMSDEVTVQINELRDVVATLTIKVDVEGATIAVDGKEVGQSPLPDPLLIAPGEHTVEVALSDHEPIQRKITILSREKQTISVEFALTRPEVPPRPLQEGPPAERYESETKETVPKSSETEVDFDETDHKIDSPHEKRSLPPIFWTGLIGTAVTGIASGVLWGLAASEKDDYESQLKTLYDFEESGKLGTQDAQDTYDDAEDTADRYYAFAYTALGLTIASGAFAVVTAVGLALHYTGNDDESRLEVRSAPGALQLYF